MKALGEAEIRITIKDFSYDGLIAQLFIRMMKYIGKLVLVLMSLDTIFLLIIYLPLM